MSVLDLGDVKRELNIDASVTKYDTDLQTTIDSVESAIANMVGPLEPTAVTVRLKGCRGALVVERLPALSLTSVTDYYGTALDTSNLYLDPSGVLEFLSPWMRFVSPSYTVTYQCGRNPLPPDILAAAVEMVRHLWVPRRGGSTRPGSAPADGLSNSLPGSAYSLPIRVQQLLDPYVSIGA